VQRKFFGKLALTFLALLLSVLLAVDFLAERTLRNNYESDSYAELKALARLINLHALPLTSATPQTPEEVAALNTWVAANSSSGVRISIIAADGRVLADSQSENATMENHAERPEVFAALRNGEGRDSRQSATLGTHLLYYAAREDLPGGTPVVLRLALPMAGFSEQLWNFRRKLWLWSLLIYLFAGAIAMVMSRGYSGRVERLREFSRRVAEGDFRPLAPDGS
jgi:two-component system phosphate regulon sensor histidine kinase PhoR